MAKQKEFVNEAELMAIMGGGAITSSNEKEIPVSPKMEEVSDTLETSEELVHKQDSKQKKYEDTFLKEGRISSRKQITVDTETHYKIESILRKVFDDKTPISIFIDNIINHHIEKYEKHFKTLFEAKSNELY
ncbi:MAG: DUF3408 domain-containing protein [Bacteroidales bacterium]